MVSQKRKPAAAWHLYKILTNTEVAQKIIIFTIPLYPKLTMAAKKNKVTINNKSVDSAGITKDYKEAIAELIWNGYDANATSINIEFDANEIDTVNYLKIIDNGDGIQYDNINETFGSFLDSHKKNSFQRSSYVRGKEGKGRFSFTTFADKAAWHTVFKKEGKLLEYTITINKFTKDQYSLDEQKISKSKKSGTVLTLFDLFNVTAYSFSSKKFEEYLANEFGWFLFLNKDNGYSLKINGEELDYDYVIAESDSKTVAINDAIQNKFDFKITYIRWKEKIGDRYYYYFLNKEKRESAKKLTSFNNNAIEFHHSVYVESDYFNDFIINENDVDVSLIGRNQHDPIFKQLIENLNGFLFEKQKHYIRGKGANELIRKYEFAGIFSNFRDNKYDQKRKKDLVKVVKELYCVQPKIFKGLKKEQEITFVGFLNLLLDTDERENILTIMEGVVQLTKTERNDLVKVLKKTSLSKIVSTIKLIENRYTVIELLKTLIFDLEKFTKERDHVQKAIQENYWIFGEQFHLASADKNFEKLLSEYLYILDGQKKSHKIDEQYRLKRPDIFMCRKRSIPDLQNHDSEIDENIMVELKRPSVVIGMDQFRQIEEYMQIIIKEPKFNSQTRSWKFFIIGKEMDSYIHDQYDSHKNKGKLFLVQSVRNYEIYAMTWDDVFRIFDIKHKYLLTKLDFDKAALEEELKAKGINLNNPTKVTEEIILVSKAKKKNEKK